MNIRIVAIIIISFFIVQSVYAQDTLKHVNNHPHKAHITDSVRVSHKSHESNLKDTIKTHKKHSVVMPQYPRSGYVAIMGGLGIPTGDFATNQGASAGSDISFSAAFPGVISHAGIAFKFDHGSNGFNQNNLIISLNNSTGFSTITCSLPDISGHCSYSSFLAGLYLTYPKKHLTIDLRILMGAMLATIPSLTVNYVDQASGNNGNYYQAETSGSAFAIDFGIEARYPVMHKLSIFLSADYLHADPTFLFVKTGAEITPAGNIINESGGQEAIADQPFSLFNLSLGVGYSISSQKRSASK